MGERIYNETEDPHGEKLRSDVFMEEIQPEDRPDGRIKRITIKLKMEGYDWIEKTGHEIFRGTSFGETEANEEARFITHTKHNKPEEEEDQVDTWDIRYFFTVTTTGTLEATTMRASLSGTTAVTQFPGSILAALEWGGGGAWEMREVVVNAGSFQGGGIGAVEGATVTDVGINM
jgi:hypothetical protein